jgi:hypothetical protein
VDDFWERGGMGSYWLLVDSLLGLEGSGDRYQVSGVRLEGSGEPSDGYPHTRTRRSLLLDHLNVPEPFAVDVGKP